MPAAAPTPELEQAILQWDKPVSGAHLPGEQLKEIVGGQKFVILHFLRHLGCIYCKHSVDEIYKLVQANPGFPPFVFVHQSTVEKGETFFSERFPGVAHISDPLKELYTLFGIKRLNPVSLVNPKGVIKGFELTAKGYRNSFHGKDDIWLLSGTFLFQQGRLVWTHRAAYAGEEPNWGKLNLG